MSTTHTASNVEQVRNMTTKELISLVLELQTRVEKLEQPKTTTSTGKEMTDDDARKVIFGELSTVKHKDAADKLGLTYGQVYSARLGFTFKTIHKEGKDKNLTNPWMK